MSNYTSSLGLEEINPGDQAGLWGNTTNNNLALIDQAVTGVTPLSFASVSGTTITLTDYNGAVDEARSAVLNITGTATGSNNVIVPNKQKTYLVRNNTGQDVVFKTATPGSTYTVGSGYSILIFCDGNNNVYTGIQSPSVGTLPVSAGGTGKTTFTAGFLVSLGGTTNLGSVPYIDLATDVYNTVLPVANGGTGQSSLASGSLIVGNGTSAVSGISPSGLNGYVLTSNGSSWYAATPTSSGVSSIAAGTGISVNQSTGAVTVTNSGVTALTAGTGIALSGSTGSVQVSVTGVPTLTANQTWSGTNTWSAGYTQTFNGPVNINNTLTTSAATSFGGNNVFENTGSFTVKSTAITYGLYTGGTTTSNSMFFANNSINFYDADTGNQYNSIYYTAASSALVDQNYSWNYKTPGSASATNAQIFAGDGGAYKTGGGSWGSVSDGRLKENAAPLTGALDKITSLNPVSFSWKFENREPTVGFIAQEVQQIIPNAVSSHKPTEQEKPFISDRTLTVGWQNDMTAYLVGAIKELKAELDVAKAEIAALKAK